MSLGELAGLECELQYCPAGPRQVAVWIAVSSVPARVQLATLAAAVERA